MKMKAKKILLCLMAMSMTIGLGFARDKKADKKKKTAEVTFVVDMHCGNVKPKLNATSRGKKE
jgi:hypothetical protein